jgi:hypothetical protein
MPIPPQAWVQEFRIFHWDALHKLASYHVDGKTTPFAWIGSPEAIANLVAATRVVEAGDEKSGALELRRVRPLNTVMIEEPSHPLSSTLRVRHTWRAIGVVRHDGHPHERVREFTCEYTLRVTEHGLKLLDCSEWHQLPDDPIE